MLSLRPATIEDLAILRHWDKQPHIIASDPNDDWQWETELLKKPAWREQLIVEVNGKPIGFMEIIDPQLEEEHYWGEIESGYRAMDLWIGEVDHLNQGYGTQMMKQAIQKCFLDASVHTILVDPISSNIQAHRFYKRLGFKFLEERRFGLDDCFVYALTRKDGGF